MSLLVAGNANKVMVARAKTRIKELPRQGCGSKQSMAAKTARATVGAAERQEPGLRRPRRPLNAAEGNHMIRRTRILALHQRRQRPGLGYAWRPLEVRLHQVVEKQDAQDLAPSAVKTPGMAPKAQVSTAG